MLLHSFLPAFARVPVALTEIGLGAVLMSAWIAFAVLGLSSGILQYAVYLFRSTQTCEGTTSL